MSDSSGTSFDLDAFVAIEKFEIANALNCSMFVALLMGIYTIIYGWSVYVCFARGLSNRYIVPATTFSALYLCNLAQFSISWWIVKWQFVDNGDNRNSIYASFSNVPLRFLIALGVLNIISLLLGNALLIWRCFLVWNGLYLVIFIPILLIVIDTLMLLVWTIGANITSSESNIAALLKFKRLGMAGFIIAACIPVIITSLIAYRMYAFSAEKGLSARKFSHIDIALQSGAVYAVSLVVFGVSGALLNSTIIFNFTNFEFVFWTQNFILYLAGIFITVMVARIAMVTAKANPSTSFHPSGLQFQPHSTHHTVSGVQITSDNFSGANGRGPVYDGSGQVQFRNFEGMADQSVYSRALS